MTQLATADIRRLFELLNEELRDEGVTGELYVVGGAVMCLVFEARVSTRDVDAFFQPTPVIRAAARRVAVRANAPDDWLNDAVKGYLGSCGRYDTYLELSHLRVLTAQPEYLLAMKCLAARIGEEFHDIDDIRYLLRYLNVTTYEKAREIVTRFYPLDRFPQKTLYLLEELLCGAPGG